MTDKPTAHTYALFWSRWGQRKPANYYVKLITRRTAKSFYVPNGYVGEERISDDQLIGEFPTEEAAIAFKARLAEVWDAHEEGIEELDRRYNVAERTAREVRLYKLDKIDCEYRDAISPTKAALAAGRKAREDAVKAEIALREEGADHD